MPATVESYVAVYSVFARTLLRDLSALYAVTVRLPLKFSVELPFAPAIFAYAVVSVVVASIEAIFSTTGVIVVDCPRYESLTTSLSARLSPSVTVTAVLLIFSDVPSRKYAIT